MGLFKKKEEEVKKPVNMQNSKMPMLPELPKLPDFPGMDEDPMQNDYSDEQLPQLPSFPNNSLGDKFSQNTIKEAVAGEKRGIGMNADGFSSDEDIEDSEENQMMQEYPEERLPTMQRKTMQQQAYDSHPNYSGMRYSTEKRVEPVFIRLDKFEESLKVFEDAKEQISEIEHLLSEIKHTKQKEEEELNSWENKIQEIKRQVEKVDQDIFSKI